jgi:glutamate racemase
VGPATPADPRAPVGVFDSGVGGLAVLAEIRRELPLEPLLYVADSGYAPYGDRPPGYIEARATAVASFLVAAGAKALVVACNTATAVIAGTLRQRFTVPVVAIEPPVKPAAAASRSGTIGVLATRYTLSSARFAELVDRHAVGLDVRSEPCADLVELVEQGELSGPAVEAAVARHLAPLLGAGADTVVLGCTHFHFLRPVVERLAGPGVAVIDPGAAVARELGRRLAVARVLCSGPASTPRLVTSGALERHAAGLRRLCPDAIAVEALPAAYGGTDS